MERNLRKNMQIELDQAVINAYPNIEIGFLIAEVSVKKQDPFVEQQKDQLLQHLQKKGINMTNFTAHPSIVTWRHIYQKDFGVNPKHYRSSLEALVKRVISGKKIWNINTIVDLYNCCSLVSLLPMGGYDLSKISNEIIIRYAVNGEMFWSLGEKKAIPTQKNHLVYADQTDVMCWLWNHKDSQKTCIDEKTKQVIFFVDSFQSNQVLSALDLLSSYLDGIKCKPKESGVLNSKTSQVRLRSLS